MYDIIIIGGGPAGLTAALYALRADKKVLIIEKNTFGGQMTFSPKIENYPGIPSASGNEIADRLVDQVLSMGADTELEEVTGLSINNNIKTVTTDSSQYEAKSIIIAAGAKHRLLGVPGEEDFIGNGISFCAVCDGAFYQGLNIAVIGGGNSAMQEALLLSETCNHVTMIQNLDFLTGEEKLADALRKKDNVSFIFGTTVKAFYGTDSLESILIHNEKTGEEKKVTYDGVFTAIGLAPENGIYADITRLDAQGYIISGETCVTDSDGIFTAGDCRTKKVRQITTAVADGAVAALAACAYIDSMK